MKNTITLIIAIAILILTAIFTLQNAQVSEIKFLFWNTQASLSLILFITFAIGVITSLLALLPVIFRARNNKIIFKKENSNTSKKENTLNNYN